MTTDNDRDNRNPNPNPIMGIGGADVLYYSSLLLACTSALSTLKHSTRKDLKRGCADHFSNIFSVTLNFMNS